MDEIYFLLKIILYGIFGYYLFQFFFPQKTHNRKWYSLYYALFGILSLLAVNPRIPFLFITGVIWSSLLNLVLKSIHNNLIFDVNIIWFGLLNVINYFLLNPIFDLFLRTSSPKSAIFLLVTSSVAVLTDLSLELRKYL